MESVLMIVTVIALALALAMAALAWKLLRENRQRSAARAEALEALAADADDRFVALDPAGDPDDDEAPAIDDLEIQPAPRRGAEWDWALATSRRLPLDPPDMRPSHRREAAAHPMFGASAAPPRASGTRWLAVAAVAMVMAGLAGGAYTLYGTDLGVETRLAALSSAASPSVQQPMELLSLRHASDTNGTFTVTGLVKNPAGSATVRNVVAVVYLFDREGNYFAGGKAPLDFNVLQAGAESPFVVRVPKVTQVSRYRVGFRTEENAVVAHVDRRGAAPDGILVGAR